jgi:hypothetical protein
VERKSTLWAGVKWNNPFTTFFSLVHKWLVTHLPLIWQVREKIGAS